MLRKKVRGQRIHSPSEGNSLGRAWAKMSRQRARGSEVAKAQTRQPRWAGRWWGARFSRGGGRGAAGFWRRARDTALEAVVGGSLPVKSHRQKVECDEGWDWSYMGFSGRACQCRREGRGLACSSVVWSKGWREVYIFFRESSTRTSVFGSCHSRQRNVVGWLALI